MARRPRKIKPLKKIKRVRRKKVYTKKDITVSKIELRFKKFLQEELKLSVEDQFQLAFKWYDFRIRSTKILIEFHGDYWHCNPSVYTEGAKNTMQRRSMKNDRHKQFLAAYNGYTLITVWEKDFNEKPEEVKKRILEEVGNYFLKEKTKAKE